MIRDLPTDPVENCAELKSSLWDGGGQSSQLFCGSYKSEDIF